MMKKLAKYLMIVLTTITLTSTQSFPMSRIAGNPYSNIALFQSSSADDRAGKRRINNAQFLEEASRSGYEKVKAMSIEERTRRAMLAEAAEDRVIMLSDELDLLLGDDGMPSKEEHREEVAILAKQIKASREQYERLVSGEDCVSLNMFGDENKSSSTDDIDLQ